jgi:hypothetical protein
MFNVSFSVIFFFSRGQCGFCPPKVLPSNEGTLLGNTDGLESVEEVEMGFGLHSLSI